MQNVIGFLAWIGLTAFAIFWPYGVLYAVFTLSAGVLLGAWAFNCTKLQHRLVFSAGALAMGLLTVLSLVIALYPGTGTFVFGRGPVGITLTVTRYGLALQLLSNAWLLLAVAPGLLGALLARGVRNRIQRRDTIPGTPGAA
jgi:hypothetical protein